MASPQRHGLRRRLLLFGAAALLPILALLGFHAWDETLTRINEERTAASGLVSMVAVQQELRFTLGRQLLAALALNPLVAAPKERIACDRLLHEAVSVDANLDGLSLFSNEGEPLCASSPDLPPTIADREYFKEALRRKQPIVSDYLVSRRNGKAAVALAHPLLDETGNVRFVLVAGLDLAWFSRTLEETLTIPDTNLVVVDSKGVVLAPRRWLGKSVADHPVFQRIAGNAGTSTFEARGIDGIERIFVARPLLKTSGGSAYAWAAVNKSAIVRNALVEFLGNSFLAFLLAIAFFLAIWRAGTRFVLQPVTELRNTAKQLGTANLRARTNLPHEADEIGELAASFDEMADAIERREADLLVSKESLQRANRALRVLSAGNHAVVRATDKDALLTEMCRVAAEEGGYKLAWIGRAEHDPARSITVLAATGAAADILVKAGLTWADTEAGRSPAGTCLRENRPVAIPDVLALAQHSPWSALAVEHDCRRVLCLPVSVAGEIWGVLCLCSKLPETFDDEEMSLLKEMAEDLGFGIDTLHLRCKEAAAQEALQRANLDLEARVAARTAALEQANRELEAFSYSASHDLRAPLRSMAGFAEVLHDDYGHLLDDEGRSHLERIRRAATRMGQLIDDLLEFARVSRKEVSKAPVSLSQLAHGILDELAPADPGRSVKASIEEGLTAMADPLLLRVALQNLLENAWKYSSRRTDAEISFGAKPVPEGGLAYFVRDNGCGFDMARAERLFQPFVRLQSGEDYPGTGIGLATVARIVQRHGGRVWAEAEKDKGATFHFTLG